MAIKRVLMEATAIVIVILFLRTGMHPATIHNNQYVNTAAGNELNAMLAKNINQSSVAFERYIITENRFVKIRKITENIDSYISIHLIYYASGTGANTVALGGYMGIYFEIGISVFNLCLTTIGVPYPMLNSNPAPEFVPIATRCF